MMQRKKKQIGVGGGVISPLAKRYVNRVLDSGRLTYGPFLKAFEKKFARLHGRRFAVSANSGTSALQVTLHALKELDGWQDGDEVIVPALTFVASSNVVIQNNLIPRFVDVTATGHIDPAKIEDAITPATRAVMPVHVFGTSCDMAPIMAVAKRHRLRVIEDSCEAVFVRYRGKPVGALGDAACYSTYMAHTLTTGVGGFAATNDPAIAVKTRSLVNHGRDSIYVSMDDDRGKRGAKLAEIIGKRFSFVSVGYSYRLTELEGALGLAELAALRKNIAARQQNARFLIRGLEPFGRLLSTLPAPVGSQHGFMVLPLVVIDPAISRDELTRWLEEWNVETRELLPLLSQPVYRQRFGEIEAQYPTAERLRKNGFYVGCHPELTKTDLTYMLAVFRGFFRKKGFPRI